MTIENQVEFRKDKKYYEERMDFLVREITSGEISRDELLKNRENIEKIMEDYVKIHGTDKSLLCFTILQDLLEGLN